MTTRKKLALDDAIPTRAREILALDLDYKDPRFDDIRRMKDTIRDEVAMARCLARRGLPPEETWKQDPDDPRIEAWKKVREEQIDDLTVKISEWERSEDKLTVDGIARLSLLAKRLHESAQVVLGGVK